MILTQPLYIAQVRDKCSETSRKLFDFLPKRIQRQLLLERDPHGNVQVSKIETERLLIDLVANELKQRKANHEFTGKFNAMNHFFGYEGRCALPSNFDCNYCYALGKTAAILLENRATGVMATITNLHLSPEKWTPGGYPLVRMMNLERRKGKIVPVIRFVLPFEPTMLLNSNQKSTSRDWRCTVPSIQEAQNRMGNEQSLHQCRSYPILRANCKPNHNNIGIRKRAQLRRSSRKRKPHHSSQIIKFT